jgi:hypothetical protein
MQTGTSQQLIVASLLGFQHHQHSHAVPRGRTAVLRASPTLPVKLRHSRHKPASQGLCPFVSGSFPSAGLTRRNVCIAGNVGVNFSFVTFDLKAFWGASRTARRVRERRRQEWITR